MDMNHSTELFVKIGTLIGGLLFISVVFSLVWYIYSIGFNRFVNMSDVPAFYTAAQMVAHGEEEHLYNPERQFMWQKKYVPGLQDLHYLNPFRNPPFVALALRPLTVFSLPQAYIFLFIVNLLLFFFIFKKMLGTLLIRSTYLKSCMLFCILSFSPVLITFIVGQLSFLLLVSFLLSYKAEKNGEYLKAGIWLSLLCIKPQYILLPLAAFLFHKRYREVMGILLGTTFLTVISFIVVGLSGMENFFLSSFQTLQWKDSFTIVPALMPTIRGSLLLLSGNTTMAKVFWLVASFTFVLLLFRAWKTWDTHKKIFKLQWSALMILTVLTSPYANIQDMSLLILPVVLHITWLVEEKIEFKELRNTTLLLLCIHLLTLFSDTVARYTRIQLLVIFISMYFIVLIMFLKRTAKSKAGYTV